MTFLAVLYSCENSAHEETDQTLIQVSPLQRQLTPDEISVQKNIIESEKSEITAGGDSVLKINIEGMEIMHYSKKQYFEDELRSQQENFKQYLDYLDRMKDDRVLNDPQKRVTSIEKHEAVVAYLKKAIGKAPVNASIYKVACYMRVLTTKRNYTQPKTLYLDSSLKKITASYGFLQR